MTHSYWMMQPEPEGPITHARASAVGVASAKPMAQSETAMAMVNAILKGTSPVAAKRRLTHGAFGCAATRVYFRGARVPGPVSEAAARILGPGSSPAAIVAFLREELGRRLVPVAARCAIDDPGRAESPAPR